MTNDCTPRSPTGPRRADRLRHALVVMWLLVTGASAPGAIDDDTTPLSVRITSPLGRTGFTGTIRIVAQVDAPPGATLQPVRFYVDAALLGEVGDGPPYAVEWEDDNPFIPHEITVEVSDDDGHHARDAVSLKPYEITVEAETLSVLLEVSVQDQDGRFITEIGASDFLLREDDVPQVLELVAPETMPATYTLLIDGSQSMARRFDIVRRAAGRLVPYLRPDDRVLVAPFSQTLGPLTGPTDDWDTIGDAITAITPHGGTAILESLANVAEHLDGLAGRHVVVLVTDGYDEHSNVTFDTALAAVKRTRATVYVIGIGGVAGISLRGKDLLRRLAVETGGRAFFPARATQLPDVHELVAADVRFRHLVGYTPTNQRHDGTWRRISLTTRDPRLRVRTRPGYFAPAPPPLRPSLEFTVTDTARRYLDVSVEDLIVVEDGVEQTVESFQEAVTPVSIVLALDASGSMRKRAAAVTEAARTFVQALRPNDSLGVVLFADRPVFAHDLTTDRTLSVEAIDQYHAVGGTALYDALVDSFDRLAHVEGRRVVVLLTDGRDEDNPGTAPGSVRTFEQALERLKETGTTVFAIGLGPKIGRAVLERLATESGGEVYFPEDVSALPDEYRRIIENLRRRYIISYSSTNPLHDGTWRTVEIRSRQPSAVITSRGGYFAPES